METVEREKLVERRSSAAVGGVLHVYLTPAGERQYKSMARAVDSWLRTLMSGMSVRELRILSTALNKLKNVVRADARPPNDA